MMSMNKGKRVSPLKEMISKSLSELQNSGFPIDPSLDEDDRKLTGPERFAKGQKAKDEVIIDSQLADISTKEGYFLKLKKEMRPNEWMLMKTIEQEWRHWPDTETEVARIVKEHTKIAPTKWGTGPYKIEYACKGGLRGKNYPDMNFYINAEEEFLTNQSNVQNNANSVVSDPTTQVTAQLDMLGRLMDVVKGVQPAPMDPAVIQKQNADAFQQGLAIKANEGNQNSAMMTAMMTGLMAMMTALATNKPVEAKVVNPNEHLSGMLDTLKTFGVLNQEREKQKTFVETIAELKMIGLDLFKKDEPLEQISKLKQIASIASDFMGMGGSTERPSILEKIVDMVGPAIPGMLKDIKDTAMQAVQVQVEAGKNIERAQLSKKVSQGEQTTHMNMGGNVVGTQESSPINNPQVQAFFNGLHDSVRQNNRMFYPIIYTSLLQDERGQQLINGVVSGSHTAKELIELLQSYGDPRFRESEFVMKHLVSYVNGFIMWLRELVKPKAYGNENAETVSGVDNGDNTNSSNNNSNSSGFVAPKGPGVDIGCSVCSTVFVYETLEEFMREESKICGNNGCTGSLQPLTKAS